MPSRTNDTTTRSNENAEDVVSSKDDDTNDEALEEEPTATANMIALLDLFANNFL